MAQAPSDRPMTLGQHLEELRWRLLRAIVVVGVIFLVASVFYRACEELVVWPLVQAIRLEPEAAKTLHLSETGRVLTVSTLFESTIVAFWVVFYLTIYLMVPYLLWELWGFIRPALKKTETSLFFLFLPAGVMCFYAGTILGYLFILPRIYGYLLVLTALDPTVGQMNLMWSNYLDNFFWMTLCLGALMDVPWLVVVLVRLGITTPEWLAKHRKIFIAISIVLAAVITPSTDIISQLAMFIPMVAFFEIGIVVSRFFRPKPTLPSTEISP
jgi:sec-independent protein translocase protein TatC